MLPPLVATFRFGFRIHPADDRPENLFRVIKYLDEELSQAYLRKSFELDYRTGELFRKVEAQGRVTREDKPAGSLGPDGRWEVSVLGRVLRRHKLVYLYKYGEMPRQINHKNGVLADDRSAGESPSGHNVSEEYEQGRWGAR